MKPLQIALHEKQELAFFSDATEILYGGAAGGGKSHLMRCAAIFWCSKIPKLQVYLFRRLHDDLDKNHMEGPTGFRELLAGWVNAGWCTIIDGQIRFWNGSRIHLCHCKDEKHRFKYQGAEIHVLMIDELTHFTDKIYRYLRGRCRSSEALQVPPEWQGQFPRILAGSNPGGEGHLWVKQTFIDNADAYDIRDMPKSEGGMKRQFIPARLDDNPSLDADEYSGKLEGLGSKELVQAMLNGDWDVIEGAFFDCWDGSKHVLSAFEIPHHWLRFRSMDWGSASPFSVGWWAVASDDHVAELRTGGRITVPRGALVRYREWYGASKPNVGLKMSNQDIARGILEREKGDKIAYGVLDSACFADNGGPSINEQMNSVSLDGKRCNFRPTDSKARVSRGSVVGGWDMMRYRLMGDLDGRPMIYCFSTCHDSIRTIPALQHDEHDAEDVNTNMEDHCFAAGTMVETVQGPIAIELMPSDGWVNTAYGLRRYRGARLVQKQAELVRVTFADGAQVTCTPDHRFIVDCDEWCYASELAGRSVIQCELSSLARLFRSSTASGITAAAGTFSAKALDCTEWYGSITKALCQRVFMSITSTIRRAISWTSSNAFRNEIILAGGMELKVLNAGASQLPKQTQQQRTGMGLSSAVNGMLSTTKNTCELGYLKRLGEFASNVARTLKSTSSMRAELGSVTRTAGRKLCVRVERLSELADVYCVTVPSTGHFAIEGGLIVSNCADEWRYACMSRPWIRPQSKVEKAKPRSDYKSQASNGGASWRV